MRVLLIVLLLAGCGSRSSVHRTHLVDGPREVQVMRKDDRYSASFKRDGVRYETTDRAVVAEVEKTVEQYRDRNADAEMFASVEQVFARAAREGKARRD